MAEEKKQTSKERLHKLRVMMDAEINATKDADEKIVIKKKYFLEALLEPSVCGNILFACRLLHISRTQVYVWRDSDKKFNLDLETAQNEAGETLADLAENALLKQIVEKQNPTLIIFTLKNKRPNKWSDRIEHTGPNGEALFGILQDKKSFEILFRVHEIARQRIKEKVEAVKNKK